MRHHQISANQYPTPRRLAPLNPEDGKVSVSWSPVSGADSYNLYYGEGGAVDKASLRIKSVVSPQTISGLRLEKFDGNKIISILDAETLKWKGDPNRWETSEYTVRTFDGMKETYQKIKTPLDTAINLTPKDFIFFQNHNQELTTSELYDVLDRDHVRGLSNTKQFEVEIYRRTADAVTNIILTIIGLAVAGRKVRGGMGLHLALAIGIGAIFILFSKFAVSFASSGTMPVLLSMWIPNLIFIVFAAWLVSKAQM